MAEFTINIRRFALLLLLFCVTAEIAFSLRRLSASAHEVRLRFANAHP
ncbi:MAG: hypothetical protein P8R42_14725 [Candidatus Binatia bacterium]|nr:hypothetical protein [Candidatus Binatia bacterium]